MRKILGLIYGTLSYLLFLGVFVYLIAFVGDILVPKSVDSGASPIATGSVGAAIAVNVGLLAVFAVQHSVMARGWFKRAWTRVVPPHLERSTYVLAATVILAGVMWGWQPIPDTVWSVESSLAATILHGLFWAGWGILLLSTFLIDHFRLFGLKQVWSHVREKESRPPEFQTPLLYRYVRHPLYLGFLLAFWSTPHMTVGRLLFAGVWTGWILLAIRFEEKDLVRFHGEDYRKYRERVPMLVPVPGRAAVSAGSHEPSESAV
ncbi:MAG: isoprenylcysteine carboxylmethyltransferase family protein [Longimicrobiales bacterium]|nr:isoprenylcysteine carboxylmethyltransferase family protein [Longimicrobiales bacterium]